MMQKELNPRLMVGVNCLVNATNYSGLPIDRNPPRSRKSGLVQFSPLFAYKEIKDETEVRLFLTKDEAQFFIQNVFLKSRRKLKNMASGPVRQGMEYTDVEGLLDKYRIDYCYLPWSWLILSPHGNIFPCGGTQYDNFFVRMMKQ